MEYVDSVTLPPVAEVAANAESGGAAASEEAEGDPTLWLELVVVNNLFVVYSECLWGVSKNIENNLNRQNEGEAAVRLRKTS